MCETSVLLLLPYIFLLINQFLPTLSRHSWPRGTEKMGQRGFLWTTHVQNSQLTDAILFVNYCKIGTTHCSYVYAEKKFTLLTPCHLCAIWKLNVVSQGGVTLNLLNCKWLLQQFNETVLSINSRGSGNLNHTERTYTWVVQKCIQTRAAITFHLFVHLFRHSYGIVWDEYWITSLLSLDYPRN